MNQTIKSLLEKFVFSTITFAITCTSQAQNIDIQLQGQRFAPHQAASPQQSVLTVPSSYQIKLGSNNQFKQISSTLYPGGIEFRFLTIGNAQGARAYDMLGWRTGTEIDQLDAKTASEIRAEAFFLDPQLLLSSAKDLKAIDTPNEWQAKYQFESFTDQAGRAATMVIDKQTQTVVSARSSTFSYYYHGQTSGQNGTTSPMLSVNLGDKLLAQWDTVKLNRFNDNQALEFQAPNGYQDKTPIGPLRVENLAAGVFRINGSASGYHMHFVVGEQSIAVFDVPFFPNEIAQIKKLIETTAPNKAISHIVFSHTHRDHIGGGSQLAQETTKIWVGKDAKQAIQRQLGDKLNAISTELSIEQNIDLGGRIIRIIPAPSSHASDMLIAYDAQSNTLFQGDFFMMPEVGPAPVGFPVNRELQEKITQLAIQPERIVSVHGRVGTIQELNQTVQLLRTTQH